MGLTQNICNMIRGGKGDIKADLVIKNVKILDIISGEIRKSDIAIIDDRIVGTHATYHGKSEIDGSNLYAVPGFIDTHLHIESSLVTPLEFDRCVLPYGVTTIICDPHEIANVLGAAGIKYFLDCAEQTIMDIRINLSSCVPATKFETSGATLTLKDILPFVNHEKTIGLAEMMNFPGVLNCDNEIIEKLNAFQNKHIDGHAPLLLGKELNGYMAAQIHTDHEATSAKEAREKLSKGMNILLREGSVSKDLDALAEILDENTSSFIALCTDDRNPLDIKHEGHIDSLIRRLIAKDRPLHHVYRSASFSAARIFGLKDRGIIGPGYRADIVLVENLQDCSVKQVICGGRIVNDELFAKRKKIAPIGLDSVKAKKLTGDDFISYPKKGQNLTPIIGVKPGLIITYREEANLELGKKGLMPDIEKDVVKVAVIERHGKNGNIGRSFVTGFGLKMGAIASSVGHDSHNITVIGANDEDMALAANKVIDMRGGFAVAKNGEISASLALPIAGLMSEENFETVSVYLEKLRDSAKELGCTLPEPFLQVAFLALPVIPHLKMTDFGLFDVDKFGFVD